MNLQDDDLIYLDLEFISRKYEEKFGADPGTKVTRQEGKKADISAFFANAGVTTQESRTYSITSRAMLHSLWHDLQAEYSNFSSFENYQGTKIAWVEGNLTLGEWRSRSGDQPSHEFYQIKCDEQRMVLLSDDSYFSAGFAKVFNASPAIKVNIAIPVRCLARIMWHADLAKNYVVCPYVVLERG